MASIFPLTFICGIVGLGVGITTSLLIVKIIAVVLLAALLFGFYKCATAMKDSQTYYVQLKYKKEKNQNKGEENKMYPENDNTKQKTNKLDKSDPDWYLLIVAWSFDQKKTNLNIVST